MCVCVCLMIAVLHRVPHSWQTCLPMRPIATVKKIRHKGEQRVNGDHRCEHVGGGRGQLR